MCFRKVKKKAKRARVAYSIFCKKHFKKLFSRRPAHEHKSVSQAALIIAFIVPKVCAS